MARMYPKLISDFEGPYSELMVYESLKNLSDDYVIFHSINWLEEKKYKNSIHRENDFIILNRKFGILMLEVKGGEVRFDGTFFHQISTDTKEDNIIQIGSDPLTQAKKGLYSIRNRIISRMPEMKNKFLIEPLIWFPSCEKGGRNDYGASYYDYYDSIFDVNDLDHVGKSLAILFEKKHYIEKNNISEEEFEKIIDIIGHETNLVISPKMVRKKLEHDFIKLTNEQCTLLDYISEQPFATIQGAAGTGKTVIAVEAAKRFAKEGRKVLFLCFNKFLYEYLKYHYLINNVDFYNINSFVAKYIEYDDLSSEGRMDALLSIKTEEIDYDDIIIDEAQDFGNDELEFFKELIESRNNTEDIKHLYIFYDKNQLVTNEMIQSVIKNSECKLLLTRNCRNTKEIAKTSFCIIGIDLYRQKYSIEGKPTLLHIENNDAVKELGDIIRYYKNEENGYSNNEITILTLKTEETSILKNVKQINGINISHQKKNNSIFFTTARKFKGLESEIIIIIDIDEKSFMNEVENRLFYVAASRAKHRLSLLINGDKEKIKNISYATGIKGFSPVGAISMKTNSSIEDINF